MKNKTKLNLKTKTNFQMKFILGFFHCSFQNVRILYVHIFYLFLFFDPLRQILHLYDFTLENVTLFLSHLSVTLFVKCFLALFVLLSVFLSLSSLSLSLSLSHSLFLCLSLSLKKFPS